MLSQSTIKRDDLFFEGLCLHRYSNRTIEKLKNLLNETRSLSRLLDGTRGDTYTYLRYTEKDGKKANDIPGYTVFTCTLATILDSMDRKNHNINIRIEKLISIFTYSTLQYNFQGDKRISIALTPLIYNYLISLKNMKRREIFKQALYIHAERNYILELINEIKYTTETIEIDNVEMRCINKNFFSRKFPDWNPDLETLSDKNILFIENFDDMISSLKFTIENLRILYSSNFRLESN